MTDSMNFGPDWIRNLSSEGSTGGGTSSGSKYHLADYRYGREEMLALFDKSAKPPASITNFKRLYSETTLLPLALLPNTEEETRGGWPGRSSSTLSGPPRGRGGSLERGGRMSRGRGSYPSYNRASGYDGGWGNGEQQLDWSPRKEFNSRTSSLDNWRRARIGDEDDGWRNASTGRSGHEKWSRSTSWRGDSESEEHGGPPGRGGRTSWHDINRGPLTRRSIDEDHLPEWVTENPSEIGGSFDERGAFHGLDDEQFDGKGMKREGIQKSTSQQHITKKGNQPLYSSKSSVSIVRAVEENKMKMELKGENQNLDILKEKDPPEKQREMSVSNSSGRLVKEELDKHDWEKFEGPPKPSERPLFNNGPLSDDRVEDNDFEKLQEDLVLKLVVDEEPPKTLQGVGGFDMGLQPPPNLSAPIQEKWFYQDPQGQMQGPFTGLEMAEWYKVGYFSHQLKVRRQCDERFFLLGELINMCGGTNPFQTTIRFPVLKNDVTKMTEPDVAQFQYLSQVAAYKQAQARILAEPWSALTLQQQELAAQRLIMQQQQVTQDIPYMQQPPSNPLMHMINQMQQANKLPGATLIDKPSPNIPGSLDPHLMHMGNILSMQNRMPGRLPNQLPNNMTGNIPGTIPPENMSASLPGALATGHPLSGLQSNIGSLGLNVPRPTTVDQLSSNHNNDPISNLLKKLHQQTQQTHQMDSLWQQSPFVIPSVSTPQWQPSKPQPDIPLSMWEIQSASSPPNVPSEICLIQQPQHQQESQQQQQQQQQQSLPQQHHQQQLPQPSEKPNKQDKEQKLKDEPKDQKKKKEEKDDKQLKKEADEKRKQEQRKQEIEKKAAEEKKKKSEEKVKKELEKAKKEAEEKRLRELEEKRRLKEQRKAEEEAKKKFEETRRLEDERAQKVKEQMEEEERRQAEERRQEQIRLAKAAPWSQSNATLGMSLTEIQKAEREKRAQEAAMLIQRAQIEREIQQQHQQQEKPCGIQLSWANKPVEPRKVKSLAEIQAEEQERLAKEAAEARLRKEKEAREAPPVQNTASIWSSQSLTWANSGPSQWTSGGFWEDISNKPQPNKPSVVPKNTSMSTISNASKPQAQAHVQQKQQPSKQKAKKEEAPVKVNHNNNNGPVDEFTNWCYKTLSSMSTNVDIPTFVTFLRDIESGLDVREYCKDYLGESTGTLQFANSFIEKRRSFKLKNNAHKDLCTSTQAITPSSQHSTEFQEVKGKNKKNKKSKMSKVDSRILGFNVTSAPDRINVGDRDYGDNS